MKTDPPHDFDAPRPAAAEAVYRIPIGASWQKGPRDAEVTIVEWADFQ